MTTVSIVIPCFNNEGQLHSTCEAVIDATAQLRNEGNAIEMILVDDASTDGTWNIITSLKKQMPIPITGLRLEKNVGAYHAIIPGMERAKGDAVIVMAADGDDPPQLIPPLILHWKEGHLLVQAVRAREKGGRQDSLFAKTFYMKMRLFGMKNLPSTGCDFMLADRSVLLSAMNKGFYGGNTLIQLYQHANSAFTFTYKKGTRPSSGWTFRKKITLFLSSLLTATGLNRTRIAVHVAEIV